MILDFKGLQLNDVSPIYQQIIKYVKINIVLGNVTNEDELPSRRLLSAILGVNPNTVQKAYRIMEEEGYVESYAGSKSILKLQDSLVVKIQKELLKMEAGQYIAEMKRLKLNKKQAKDLLDYYWGDNNGE